MKNRYTIWDYIWPALITAATFVIGKWLLNIILVHYGLEPMP